MRIFYDIKENLLKWLLFKEDNSWLLIFKSLLKSVVGLFYECRLFFKKNWILPIKDRANLEIMMLLGTDSIKTTLPWHYFVCAFCWRPKCGWGVSGMMWDTCAHSPLDFFIPERERWFLCTGSWKAMTAWGMPWGWALAFHVLCNGCDFCMPSPTSLFLLQGTAWIVSGSYSPSPL